MKEETEYEEQVQEVPAVPDDPDVFVDETGTPLSAKEIDPESQRVDESTSLATDKYDSVTGERTTE